MYRVLFIPGGCLGFLPSTVFRLLCAGLDVMAYAIHVV